MPVDNTFDPVKSDRYEQRYGEDPVIAARDEEKKKEIQRPAREYLENTLKKASTITLGLGTDRFGMPIIQTYHHLQTDFKDAIFMAEKLIMVYFLCERTEENKTIVIDGVGVVKVRKQPMKIDQGCWSYTLTDNDWVEVVHGAE